MRKEKAAKDAPLTAACDAGVMLNKMTHRIYLTIILALLQGCSSIYARLTYDFNTSKQDSRVFYETGAEDLATEISAELVEYISTVERVQYQSFKSSEELKVYVFADKNHYANFSNSSSLARGSATTNEIYISPIIRERIETLGNIVVHELSHVHLRQYIGTWSYWTEFPGWFHEGLAVEISGGGGAEKVSNKQAIAELKSGKHFTPREESDLFGHKFAHDYGLKPQLYYRQSNLFVRYLINQNPEAFKAVYLALIKGAKFSDVWAEQYGKSIPALWQNLLNEVQA